MDLRRRPIRAKSYAILPCVREVLSRSLAARYRFVGLRRLRGREQAKAVSVLLPLEQSSQIMCFLNRYSVG